ncbi:hypothetical protein NQ318_014202 [Aromia moschata]|uniref:Caspase Dronc n=1 Tax=Aromia moschata TaxID=1265417 RepID=A0AAV8X530_9CUCU|nr:hypothetical protein NQ318_014202 [Aromia moschata]
MMNKLKQFINDSSLKKVDMSIVVMMSHGNNIDNTGRIVHGGFTQIYGVDNEGLQIDTVLDLFSAESCRALAGKPKIFIFQCCRGDKYETLHHDAAPMRDIKRKHSDMLIAFSTLPGFYSIRDTVQGSWYIQSIYEVFKRHTKEFDVETLLKIVDQELSKKHPTYKQTSMYESRGFKCCYLNPK